MKTFLTLLFCLHSIFFFAQDDVIFDTLYTVSSNNDDNITVIKKDVKGNLYYSGWFEGTADFDPKSTVFTMTSGIYRNAFVVKLDSNENFIWAKQLKYTSHQGATINDIAIDTNGNVYLSGHWSSSVDFDPGPAVKNYVSNTGQARAFILKLDQNGEFTWFRFIQATADISDDCYGNAMEMDDEFNIYLTGGFTNTGAVATDGIGHTFSAYVPIESSLPSCSATTKNYVIKYNKDGVLIWFKELGLCGIYNGATDITLSPSGNLYVVGDFTGTIHIETASGTVIADAQNSSDAHITKLNTAGDIIWIKQIESIQSYSSSARIFEVVIDTNENVFFVGHFEDTVDMDPGVGTHYFYSPLLFSSFISKLDHNGDFVWAKLIQGTSQNYVGATLAIDENSNLFLAGSFFGTTTFGGLNTFTAIGESDIYFLKCDKDGNFIWVKRIGGTHREQPSDLLLDKHNDIYFSGFFESVVDFDPNLGVFNVSSTGHSEPKDGFLLKLNQCKKTTSIFTHTSCGPYVWHGTTYNYSNNTATYTLPNASGCDSIVTLNLIVEPISESTFTHTSCGPYLWINGATYTTNNNTATHRIPNGGTNGCDSIVKLKLTIVNVNNTVSLNDEVLTANQTGATYQWVDCNNGNSHIQGATARSYTITSNGSYAVKITKNGCTKISDCYNMTNLGIADVEQLQITIHPNPADNFIYIQNIKPDSKITITDLAGKVVDVKIDSAQSTINTASLLNGIYFLNVSNSSGISSKKFIIQR